MNVSLLCPSPEYVLDERFMKAALENAAAKRWAFSMPRGMVTSVVSRES
jgi:hypothetical protein